MLLRDQLRENGLRARAPERARPARWQWKTFNALCWQIAELTGRSSVEVKEAAKRAWKGDLSYAGLGKLNAKLEELIP